MTNRLRKTPKKAPSKNTKCPCGSGSIFRKCCGKNNRLIAAARKIFSDKADKKKEFQTKHGFARPPMSMMFGGKRMIVVGGSIYQQSVEGPYGFMNFVHDCAIELFGIPYLEQQALKQLEKRHPAVQWMHIFVEHYERLLASGNVDSAARQIGAGGAWLRFGYDLFTIRDNAQLQARMKERLLNIDDFQAARHELAVAAICVAAGFDISYEDESDNSRKHPEFIATDKLTGFKIAVEAKSRRRHGIKGFAGGRIVPPQHSVGIRGLVTDAFQKVNTLPLYIFIDVNLPEAYTPDTYQGWLNEIEQTMVDLSAEGYGNPSPANIVFFTNDPSHYVLERQLEIERDELWFKHYEAAIPVVPHPSDNMARRILDAFTTRIAPPGDFPD